jgi:hypothetical protein
VGAQADAARSQRGEVALPIPPAPPGERGYLPGDVERLLELLADSPTAGQISAFTLSRADEAGAGAGYHPGVVDALTQAWIDELTRRGL